MFTSVGLWAIEMADAFPSATVIGIDLSPIQPGWTPPNCYFFVDDAEQVPWEFEQKFDIIHIRSMEAAFGNWSKVYEQVFENLHPGGIVENQSQESWIHSLDRDTPDAVMEWQSLLVGASRSFGRDMHMSKEHKRLMQEAGFQDIEEVVYKIPIGPWAKSDKQLSEVCLGVMLEGVESYSLQLLTRELGMSVSVLQLRVGSYARTRHC